MNTNTKINPAKHQPTDETKTWLYNVCTFRGGEKIYPFVLTLGIEELAQLHALLQLHADDLSNTKVSNGGAH